MSDHDPSDPSRLRISDEDRHRVAEVLREAAGEGRLELDELDERLEATFSAKVYADLVPILVDLPGGSAAAGGLPVPRPSGPAPVPARPEGPADRHDSSVAVMGEQHRRGRWELGPEHSAFALMGSVTLDLREAALTAGETVITANVLMGSVDVVVDATTRVLVDGIGVMGSFEQSRDRVPAELDTSSPVVRVKGVALMGAVTVVRKAPPGTPGRWRRALGG